MGIFSRKNKSLELELPPPPPPMEELPPISDNQEMDLPPLLGAEEELPPMVSFPESEANDLPEPPRPEDFGTDVGDEELPPLPSLNEEELPALEFPSMENVGAGPVPSFDEPVEESPRRLRIRDGPVYVSVGSYRAALNDLNLIRAKVKESEDCIERLNEIKNLKDKYIEQFRAKLEDLQRKSLYVDKSLFERR